MTNNERANRIERALASYRAIDGDAYTGDEKNVSDFLTNLHQFCDRAGLNLGNLDRIAHGHYQAEPEDEPLPLLPGL